MFIFQAWIKTPSPSAMTLQDHNSMAGQTQALFWGRRQKAAHVVPQWRSTHLMKPDQDSVPDHPGTWSSLIGSAVWARSDLGPLELTGNGSGCRSGIEGRVVTEAGVSVVRCDADQIISKPRKDKTGYMGVRWQTVDAKEVLQWGLGGRK